MLKGFQKMCSRLPQIGAVGLAACGGRNDVANLSRKRLSPRAMLAHFDSEKHHKGDHHHRDQKTLHSAVSFDGGSSASCRACAAWL